ncbi:MAG: hypothetical protein FWE30_01030 [Bacteroidales bacterium]|nr:hypothetical protein [Bacteroidales bacterium]
MDFSNNASINERLCSMVKSSLEQYKLKIADTISGHDRDLETAKIFDLIQYCQDHLDKDAGNYNKYLSLFSEFHNDVENLYSNFMHNDLELSEAFTIILEKGTFKNYIADIIKLICNNELDREGVINRENLNNILKKYHIDLKYIRLDLLDLILLYINFIINTHIITEKESLNIKILKNYFKIKEGDFYKYRFNEVKSICKSQFVRLSRNNMDYSDELFWVGIKDMFNLDYMQLEKMKL